jgi:hypothetical protein
VEDIMQYAYDDEMRQGLDFTPVAAEAPDVRGRFVFRTYSHLFGAIIAFALVEVALFQSGAAETISKALFGIGGNLPWLVVLGGFMLVTWVATRGAHTSTSAPILYGALGAVVVAEALIFVPILYIANTYYEGIITSAAAVTFVGFSGLTAIAFVTRKDFSFLRPVLYWGGLCAMMMIVMAVVFGFNLGVVFSVAMVAFAGAAILYDTSNVLHHYPEDRYVAASLQLFTSVALMFWYVLRIFMSRD